MPMASNFFNYMNDFINTPEKKSKENNSCIFGESIHPALIIW